ncbi:MAG TPA: alkene reductase [Burkholderiales bacterium]|nr:alkene reductase [Burkholderiales bacterium]
MGGARHMSAPGEEPGQLMTDLFSPLKIGDLHLPNRIIMAPLTRSRATMERVPTPMMAEHYVQRASAGLIIAEATNVVPQSIAWDCAPGIFTPEQIEAWARVVRAVHDAGGRIALQLWHGGRVACDRSPAPKPALSPSGVNEKMDAITVWGIGPEGKFIKLKVTPSREMTLEEIRATIRAFGAAARTCKEVGFDAIELHGANGYLPHQFLSPFLNRRTDDYGGTPEKRAQFAIEVVEAMMEHYPPSLVGIRISPYSDYNGAIDPDPAPAYQFLVRTLNERKLGFLELADTSFWYGRFERSRMLDLVKPVFDGIVIANGGIEPAQANELISQGAVDAVSFGRLWMANPDLPERIRRGGPYAKPVLRRSYGGGPDGYNDYPTLAQEQAKQGA